MATKVVNIRSKEAMAGPKSSQVYIGRAGRGETGPWGNPFPLRDEADRANVLLTYIHWLKNQLDSDPSLRARITSLRGKTLVCFCAPRMCHGDILALLAEGLAPAPERETNARSLREEHEYLAAL